MRPVLIFGAGDIAEIAHFYLTTDAKLTVSAFTVDREYCRESSFCNAPLVPFDEVTTQFPPREYDMFVALSYANLNTLRALKCVQAKEKGYSLISYISSKATAWPGISIGENCFILEDNTIQPFVRIGSNVTIWSGNHIGHHSRIGDNCFISSHVVVSGGVDIGKNCFIGVNATIRDHVKIGQMCIIGAGALVLEDAAEKGVYAEKSSARSRVPSNRIRKV